MNITESACDLCFNVPDLAAFCGSTDTSACVASQGLVRVALLDLSADGT